jgi:hypothetical protein
MSGWRMIRQAVVAWLVGVAVLFGAVSLALSVPLVSRLGGFGGVSLLDYVRQHHSFVPLSADYVRRMLHLGAGGVSGGDGAGGGGGAGGSSVSFTTGSPSGHGVVLRHAFTNDDFGHAVAVPALPFTAETDTAGSSRQPGEPTSCAAAGGTAWYRWRTDHLTHVFADTFGTHYADDLAVFTGSSLHNLRQQACGSDLKGSAQTGFTARPGVTYWFQITGPLGGGPLTFHLTAVGPTVHIGGSMTALWMPALSANGRYVAFAALPTEMQPGVRVCPQTTTAFCPALFITDLATGRQRLLLSVHNLPVGPMLGASQAGALPRLTDLYLSANGRFLAFASDDPQLVSGDTNGLEDAFVLDVKTGTVTRVSVNSQGAQATLTHRLYRPDGEIRQDGTQVAGLSADGRYVVFTSDADNLVAGDTNDQFDVFWHDRRTGRTRRVSVDEHGLQPAGRYAYVADTQPVTAHGRYVLWVSFPDDNCGSGPTCDQQLRVWDARTGRSRLLRPPIGIYGTNYTQEAISSDGRWVGAIGVGFNDDYRAFRINRRTGAAKVVESNLAGAPASSQAPETARLGTPYQDKMSPAQPYVLLSRHGRYLVYDSYAANLVPADTNGDDDVFVRDMALRGSARVSLSPLARQWTTDSFAPAMSADGRVLVYLVDSNAPAIYVHRSLSSGTP